jgi:hypothetical protein
MALRFFRRPVFARAREASTRPFESAVKYRGYAADHGGEILRTRPID